MAVSKSGGLTPVDFILLSPYNHASLLANKLTFDLPKMNRSTRSTKHPRLDDSLSKSSSSIDSDTLGRGSGGLSPILPKPASPLEPVQQPVVTLPPITSSADFFPELNIPMSREFNNAVTNDLVLPDPIPPLPPSLNTPSLNKVYNTRKRTGQEVVAETSSPSPPSVNNKPVVIPGFVSKLYRMVNESTSNLIKWGIEGNTFIVTSPEDFSRQVLPLFFKHNNFSSFVRQLNMYGFHKVPHLQQGTLATSAFGNNESNIWEFSNVNFIRNRPDLLINVRRKIGKEDGGNSTEVSPTLSNSSISLENVRISPSSSAEDFIITAKNLKQEVQYLHQQQNALRTDLHSLQRDNQLLWNENLASRERHLQQQQVIDRILRFLASVFTADGKLLTSSNIAGLNSTSLSALQSNLMSNSTSSKQQQRPLLIGNISANEDELRRQVLELISGTTATNENNSGKIDLINDNQTPRNNFINFNHKIEDLESTTDGISKDISVVDDELSNVIRIAKNDNDPTGFDDLDFSSYLNCQSLE